MFFYYCLIAIITYHLMVLILKQHGNKKNIFLNNTNIFIVYIKMNTLTKAYSDLNPYYANTEHMWIVRSFCIGCNSKGNTVEWYIGLQLVARQDDKCATPLETRDCLHKLSLVSGTCMSGRLYHPLESRM
jgi:hypothetical protein